MISKEKKVFFLYTFAISLLVAIGVSFLYYYNSREDYIWVVRIYTIVEYTLLAYYFSLYLKKRPIKIVLLLSVIAFFIFCIFSFISAKPTEMPFVPANLKHLFLLLLIIYYFFEVLQNSIVEPIYQRAIFWVCVAFIINSAGNFFLFLYSKNSYNNDETFQKQYIIIYATVTVIKNLFLCISVIIKDRKEDNTSENLFDIDLDSPNSISVKP